MLCSMCQHGVNIKRTWKCVCGERSCLHIGKCDKCGRYRSDQKCQFKLSESTHHTITGIHGGHGALILSPPIEGGGYHSGDLLPDIAWIETALKQRLGLREAINQIDEVVSKFVIAGSDRDYANKPIEEAIEHLTASAKIAHKKAGKTDLKTELAKLKDKPVKRRLRF